MHRYNLPWPAACNRVVKYPSIILFKTGSVIYFVSTQRDCQHLNFCPYKSDPEDDIYF
jgi:hypothetical protein